MKIIFLTSILPIIYIIWFLCTYQKRKRKKTLKSKVLADGVIDYKNTFTNMALSISKSKKLYKKLIIQVHPDKFLDDRKKIADELSAKITNAQKNYNELTLLENEVKLFLENNG